MKSNTTAAALMAMMRAGSDFPPKIHHEKEAKKCALPTCTNLTKHNGGYCCADHYHEHKRQLKTNE